MQTIDTQCAYLLALADPILAPLDDSHLALEPMPGAKTAGWLVGHLVVSGDYARRLCGHPALCPDGWYAAFAPGSRPSTRAHGYPPMAVLIRTFGDVHRDLRDVARTLRPEVSARPNPYEPARAAFPTVGDFIAYLMTGHLGYHLGQLGAWQAAAGLGPVRRPDHLAA